MGLRKFIKAVRWFALSPVRRGKYFFAASHRKAAAGMHWSTELTGCGFLDCEDAVVIGRRTQLNVPIGASITLKRGVWVGDDCELGSRACISIGSYTSLQNRSIILGDVFMGAGCICGPNLYISSAWHHFDDIAELPIRWQDAQAVASVSAENVSRQVSVGDDCWFGINVVITPGVRIGRGCVIGSNSVVTHDIPPYAVAAGSPARVIRYRLVFSPPKWLRASEREHIPYFYSGFRQWGNGIESLKQALDADGWSADEFFSLAMAVENGAKIILTLKSDKLGRLVHGMQEIDVPAGKSEAGFLAEPTEDGFLFFRWTSYGEQYNSTMILIAVDQQR